MTSKEPSDLLSLEEDLVTTEEDVQALREARSTIEPGPDWLERLTELSEMFPEDSRPRRTFAGYEPFEL